ncbi:MAG: hypothetical protein WD751_11710 [Anaerolineales bacterium]
MSEATIGSIIVAIITAVIGPILVFLVTNNGIRRIRASLPSWKLLYENDENGNRTRGSIKRLVQAVKSAYPIKVRMVREDGHSEIMEAQWVFEENDLVHASNVDQISMKRDKDGNYSFMDDAYHYYVVINTKGMHHASRFFIGGRKRDSDTAKRRMAWYGQVPPR